VAAEKLGSTRLLTNADGTVSDRYNYDAYGVLLTHAGANNNSFLFAGEQRDSATGLDYLRARYYDPDLGRFISKDPFYGFITRAKKSVGKPGNSLISHSSRLSSQLWIPPLKGFTPVAVEHLRSDLQ
jgi:RHS repeat-associated protein